MASNTNFAVALHSLSILAAMDRLVSSEAIAQSVSTNPVVVRRLLGHLVRAGMVRSEAGKNGGFVLAKAPRRIRLKDVLAAVDDGAVFRVHPNEENPACYVSCGIKDVLGGIFSKVEQAVVQELGKTTLADVVDRIAKS